jgi:hypothetical protein
MPSSAVLRYRLTSSRVIAPFYERLAFEFGPHRDQFHKLPEAWEALNRIEAIPFAVVERVLPPDPPQLVAHGASVFLSDAMVDKLSGEPFVAAQVVREALAGGDGVLSLKEIRKAQTQGDLNLLLLHAQYLEAPTGLMGEPGIYEVLARSFFEHHCGYRIRQCFIETFSSEAMRHHIGAGLLVRANHGTPEPTAETPWLLGISRKESEENPGARISSLFVERPIRLGLRKAHREVLSLAMVGAVDEEISAELCLTLSAIKRRWESIYDAVDRQAPDLVWGSRLQMDSVRGPERRRHLLNFLREHPEEMRPLVD